MDLDNYKVGTIVFIAVCSLLVTDIFYILISAVIWYGIFILIENNISSKLILNGKTYENNSIFWNKVKKIIQKFIYLLYTMFE